MRKLISYFIEFPQIKLRPFSVGYEIKDSVFPCSKTYIYGIKFVDPETLDPKPNKVINLREPVKKFVTDLDKKRNKKNETNLRINIKALKDLPIEILESNREEGDKKN